MPGNRDQSERVLESIADEANRTGRLPRRARKRYMIAMTVVGVSGAVGNVLLKYGLRNTNVPPIESISALVAAAVSVAATPWLNLGVILLVVQFVALTYALRSGPLSLTVPIRGASIYVLTALLAQYFLGEQVTSERWGAIMLILAGMTMIGISSGGES